MERDFAKFIMLDNEYLFSKNIMDCLVCVCGSFEDAQHFLLSCTRYTILRQELVNKVSHVCQPPLNVHMFGSQELSNSADKQIVLAVQDFSVKSKCFEVNNN